MMGGPCTSISAAAIAAAAVSAAAAAVGAASGPSLTSQMGLPSIHEDHELNENMLFDNDDSGAAGCSVMDPGPLTCVSRSCGTAPTSHERG